MEQLKLESGYTLTVTTLNKIKRGAWFTLKPYEQPNEMQVLIRGDYDRATKSFSCYYFGDVNHERFLKASRKVYTDFIF